MTTTSMARRWQLGLPGTTVRILVALVVIVAVFTLISPDHIFFSSATAQNIGLSAAEAVILASGMTIVIVSGNLDLSVGSQLMVSAIIGASVMQSLGGSDSSWGVIFTGLVVMAAIGALFGLINGLLTVVLRVPSFIVTLGTFGTGLGVAQLLTAAGGSSSDPAPQRLGDFGLSDVVGIPTIVIVALVVVLVSGLILSQSRFGLHCYATGSNPENARRSGVPTNRVTVTVFVAMGLLSALAGFVDLARFTAVSTSTHQSDNLTAIAAVIIGGASLFGGRGTILGTLIGTLVPVALLQGFIIQGVNPYWQNVAIGLILIAAVAGDRINKTLFRMPLRAKRSAPTVDAASPAEKKESVR